MATRIVRRLREAHAQGFRYDVAPSEHGHFGWVVRQIASPERDGTPSFHDPLVSASFANEREARMALAVIQRPFRKAA